MTLIGEELTAWVREHGYIEVRWARASDDVNRITVSGMSARGFGGRGQGWIDEASVRTFALRLGDFPLNQADLPTLVVGSQRVGEPVDVQVGLRVYPVGSRGQLGIQVRLAIEAWHSPPMRDEEHESAVFEVRTTYKRVAQFGRDLLAALKGEDTSARIEGEHLA